MSDLEDYLVVEFIKDKLDDMKSKLDIPKDIRVPKTDAISYDDIVTLYQIGLDDGIYEADQKTFMVGNFIDSIEIRSDNLYEIRLLYLFSRELGEEMRDYRLQMGSTKMEAIEKNGKADLVETVRLKALPVLTSYFRINPLEN